MFTPPQIKFLLFVNFLLFNLHVFAQKQPQSNLTQYVNTFIGTGGHGHTYPGATVPFGMIQLSPDTRLTGWDGCSGYHYSDDIIYGFSHTHLSGTGVSDLGDILFMPTTGEIRINNGADGNPGYRSRFSKEKENASPGFYQCYLEDYNIEVKLAAGRRVGIHEYRFDKSTTVGNLIIDLAHRDKVLDAGFEVLSDTEVQGYRISQEWAREQHVYFYAKFSKPMLNTQPASDEKKLVHALEFGLKNDPVLTVQIGISAVSMEGARRNLEAELNDFDIEKLKARSTATWEKALSKIQVFSEDETKKEIFYSALYHTMIVPNLYQDADRQYRGMDLNIHQTTDHDHYTIFSLWDTYRAAHPLYTIIEQERTNNFIRTFLDQYDKGSILPIWELNSNYTSCMIGYHAIPVIADAYQKGIRDYNVAKALKAMQHSAMQDHLGLHSYKKSGYIFSEEESESVSKTLEYAYDDWCIATMAKSMGKDAVYKNYLKRSQYWKNIFDPTTGFMRAKKNNTWVKPFHPAEVNFHFTEANSWQYSFYVPHDIEGLIRLHGGKVDFEQKLDELFTTSSETLGREQVDITGLIGQYAHGNEPSHHMAYLYNYVNKPWKTQQKVHEILTTLYAAKPDGLSGNEDCGQMSAWYVLSAMGLYPVAPGDNMYNIGTPLFSGATIHLENGKEFAITAANVSDKNIYIQKAFLNGEIYNKCYIKHEDIMRGGTLSFEMGDQPNKAWGSGEDDLPPSAVKEALIVPLPFVREGASAFVGAENIVLGHVDKEAEIYYTLDGSIPNLKSLKYTAPIKIEDSATLRFLAAKNGLQSQTISARFYKIPVNRKITLSAEYASQYAAGGGNALVDFVRGSRDFRTGAWQGYWGPDVEAVVDLEENTKINKIALSCLQDQNSWIFMPKEVVISVSKDGKKFKEIATIKNDIDKKADGGILKEFTCNKKTKARFVKVLAKNSGPVPQWHKGAGGKSWIFVDEIIIE